MKRGIVLFLAAVMSLQACTTVPTLIESPEPTMQPTLDANSNPTAGIPTAATDLKSESYTDPEGQFRLLLPEGWEAGDEEGLFFGPGVLQVRYLPEMAYMDTVYRVCERLANTPQGPGRRVRLYPFAQSDACLLEPYPEMSTDQVRLVVANPSGAPEQRYLSLEVNQRHIESIADSLELLNPQTASVPFPYPTGPVGTEDEAFWAQSRPMPEDLWVEEYAIVEDSIGSPTRFEFRSRIPDEVFQKRAALRERNGGKKLSSNNQLLEAFGYSLKTKDGAEMELYELYRDDELLLDEISAFWPVSISGSGKDFGLVVELLDSGYRLVRKDSLETWDLAASHFIPPIFHGEELVKVAWDPDRNQVLLLYSNRQVYAFSALYLMNPPVKGLWLWQNCSLMEIDGFLIQCGELVNERRGYDEVFGWQYLNEKSFYYFRKGPRVGISYDERVLPLYYEEIVHGRCCEPAAFNNGGNEDIAWFYGLREGVWYYVEIGKG